MRSAKGNVAVEFVFVFPWLLAAALGIMKAVVWMGSGALSHYLSFETGRLKALYFESLPIPIVNVRKMEALEGYSVFFENRKKGDNPIRYCGKNGRYRQCEL